MVIKKINILLLVSTTLVLLSSTCKKDRSKPCQGGRYSFDVSSEFSPQRASYNVGDTIFLNSYFSKNLFDIISNQNIDYSNSTGIIGNFAIGLMDSTSNMILPAVPKFKIVNFLGTTSPNLNSPDGGLNIQYLENVNYSCKIGVVCLSKGLFRFGLTSLSSQGLVGKNCTNAGFDMTVTNSNKNINLFQFAIGYYPDALAVKTIYCFRVQ